MILLPNLENVLSESYAILTAENPYHVGKYANIKDNHARDILLKHILDDYAQDAWRLLGKYESPDVWENSWLIINPDLQLIAQLAHDFGQDSFITGHLGTHTLVYPSNRADNIHADSITWYESEPEQYFSKFPATGEIFSIDFVF